MSIVKMCKNGKAFLLKVTTKKKLVNLTISKEKNSGKTA